MKPIFLTQAPWLFQVLLYRPQGHRPAPGPVVKRLKDVDSMTQLSFRWSNGLGVFLVY